MNSIADGDQVPILKNVVLFQCPHRRSLQNGALKGVFTGTTGLVFSINEGSAFELNVAGIYLHKGAAVVWVICTRSFNGVKDIIKIVHQKNTPTPAIHQSVVPRSLKVIVRWKIRIYGDVNRHIRDKWSVGSGAVIVTRRCHQPNENDQ